MASVLDKFINAHAKDKFINDHAMYSLKYYHNIINLIPY